MPSASPLRIHCLTFNVAGFGPLTDFENKTKLEQLFVDPEDKLKTNDICVIGLQEIHSRLDKYFLDAFVTGEDEWTHVITVILSEKGFIRLKFIRLLGTVLIVFVHTSHLLHIREVDTQYVRLSAGGYLGLKGAVALRMKLYGVTMCFVNSHLSAHDHNLKLRVEEYNKIVESIVFKYEDTPNILHHDYIIWCGDLNFRIEEDSHSREEIIEFIKKGNFKPLLEKDQLVMIRDQQLAFHELHELLPDFAPTYKFKINSDEYDEKRRPAYTDRILFRCNEFNYAKFHLELTQLSYRSHNHIKLSDHRPVSSLFNMIHFCKKDNKNCRLSAFDPIVKFNKPEDWTVGRDGKIVYHVEAGMGGEISRWDWIGLFKANFKALSDYVGFTWASSCRLTGVEKTALIMDATLSQPGNYVLIYFGVKNCVMGMSEAFPILPPDRDFIEVAEEAFEIGAEDT